MQGLKRRIAEVFARREQLKQALESGALAPRAGFAALQGVDSELADLDGRYKVLWDARRRPNGKSGDVFQAMKE